MLFSSARQNKAKSFANSISLSSGSKNNTLTLKHGRLIEKTSNDASNNHSTSGSAAHFKITLLSKIVI